MFACGLIARRARSWRRQWAVAILIEGAARLVGCAIAALTAAVWLDRLWPLPQAARWTAWMAGAVAWAAAVYAWGARPFLLFDWATIFDAAAGRFPEVGESLKAAWELSRGVGPGVSQDLARAHVERTEGALAGLPWRVVFPPRPSRAARAAALAGFAFAASWWPLRASPSWERMLAPWWDVPLERYVAVSPGDAELQQGAAAVLSAQWRPGAPAAAPQALALWLRGPDGWRTAAWDSVSGPAVTYQVEALTSSLEYRLSWGGLRSKVYRLTPVTVPELESLRVTLQGPQPETTSLSGAQPFSALRGSWLTVTGTPNQPLSKAYARLASWPVPLAMRALPGGDWQVSFALREDSELSFELEGEGGRKDPHPAAYQLKALADEPPQIQLLSPVEPLVAGPRDEIPITYTARDDGGLTRISLLVWPAGRTAQETTLDLPGGRREAAGDASIDLSELPLGRLQFQLKALDTARPAQAGFSGKGVIDVVDLDAVHSQTQSLWLKAGSSLKSLSDRERQAQALAAARSPELGQKQEELSRAWDAAASDLQALASQMASDAYANPGLASMAKDAAQGLSQAAARRLPGAEDAAKRGDFEAARQEHERLGRQVEAARRLLEEGRKVQGLQDVFSETGRMSQAAQALQSALQAPAATGKSVPREQLANLQRALGRLEKQMDRLLSSLSKLPKAAPGQEGSQGRQIQLPLESARQSAGELAKALASGDYAKAERLAERLAEQLSQVERGLSLAASDAASSGDDGEATRKLDQARGQWSELVDEQTRVVERTQKLEDERLTRTLQAQRDLLAELERRQAVAVSSAQALGAAFPQDALSAMRSIQSEFASRRVSRSAPLLSSVSARLRLEAGAAGQALEPFASEEDDIRRRLETGAQAKASPEGAQDAGKAQADVRQRTQGLERRLRDTDAELPDGALEGLEGAQSQQQSAETSLGQQDSASALSSEQKALELLEQGAQKLSQEAGQRQQRQAAIASPFQRPGGGGGSPSAGAGGALGARMTFVPLPSAQDYRPAPEIRKELEKSLREPRPPTYDGVIKEYFKRIAQ